MVNVVSYCSLPFYYLFSYSYLNCLLSCFVVSRGLEIDKGETDFLGHCIGLRFIHPFALGWWFDGLSHCFKILE
jgi:hypothetical protein